MGSLTLPGLVLEVRYAMKNPPDTSASGLSDTRIQRYINYAYHHISHPSVYRHRELMSTFNLTLATGTQAYTFTPQVSQEVTAIRSVVHIANTAVDVTSRRTRVRPADPQWFDERTPQSGSTPRRYAIEGSTMLVDPVPGAAQNGQILFVRCFLEPATLAGIAATALNDRWDEAIILGATWLAQAYRGYRDLAENAKIDFVSLVNEFKSFDDVHGREDFEWSTDFRIDTTMESTA